IEPSQSELEAEAEEVAALTSARSEPKGPPPSTNPASSPDPAALYRKALSLKQAGEFSQALALLDRLTDDGVWGIKALGQKGLCLKAIGRYEDALAAFRTALDRPSGSTQDLVSLRYLYARTLESMGRSQEAVDCYRTISRESRQYRDVALRLDQLQPTTTLDDLRKSSPQTWIQSLVRSCSQLLRSTS
ncbi:MAG: tetratricopeptide repeat protein, partial [Nitrospira sp.]